MKKILMLLSSIILIITSLLFYSYSAEPILLGNGCYDESSSVFWSVYDDGSLVIEGAGKIVSFESDDELPYSKYFKNDYIETLIIKDGVTEIGNFAFSGCTAKTIEIASSVKKIGDYSFFGMKNAESISLSEKVSSIGNGAFSCSEKLRVYVDSNNEKFTIDGNGIIYNKTITEIIFCPCESALSDYKIPLTVERIKDYAFSGAENLTEVIMPRTMNTIGKNAFENCKNLETVVINYGLEIVSEAAFNGCNNINGFFYRGTKQSLSEINMNSCGFDINKIVCGYCDHNNTDKISASAAVCNSPGYTESIFCNDCGVYTVPKEIVTDEHVDSDGNSLCDVCGEDYCKASFMGFCNKDYSAIWVLYDNGNLMIYGKGSIDNYFQGESPFYEYRNSIRTITVTDEITHIGKYAFYGLSCLEIITGGEGVVSVGDSAFENSVVLRSVKGLSNVETVSDKAFKNCALTDFGFCEKVRKIGVESFCGCKFTNIVISGATEALDDRAFYSCSSLERIFIGSDVEFIGNDVFGKCISLRSITVDGFNSRFNSKNGVLFGGNSKELIKYPPALTGGIYEIPDGTESVAYGAFSDSDKLETVVINPELKSVGDYAFSDCSSIADIEIPYGVSKIGQGAFYNCTALKNIIIADSVLSVGDYAFSYCTGLEEVIMPALIDKIPEGTFADCDSLKKITIKKNIKAIEKCAFSLCKSLEIVICDGAEEDFGEISVDKTGNEYYIAIPKHFSSHVISDTPQIKPLCINPGYTAGTYCKECDFYFSGHSIIPAEYVKHSIGEYVVFEESTCTRKGKERAYCTRDCGYYAERETALKKHSYLTDTVLSTCTEKGYITYTCSCGKKYTEEIPELAEHRLSKYRVIISPGCTTKGTERADCTECSYYKERSIPAKGHAYRTKTKTVEPTCKKGGYTVYTCKCGKSDNFDEKKKLGHDISSKYTVDIKATCTKPGSKSRHCKRCNSKTDVKEIDKLKHDYTYVVKSATSKKDGSKNKVCTLCDKVSSTEKIYKIKTVKLSETSYVYDRKVKKPDVIVKNSKDKKLKEGTDYTLKYQSGRKKTGRYTVKVTFKGNYTGTKTLEFVVVPQNVKIVSSSPSYKNIKLNWNEVKGATGYRIYYYNSKTKEYVTLKDTKSLSYTVAKLDGASLESGKDYKFGIRAYSDNSGEKVFSKKMKKYTSSTKPGKVKIKKSSASSTKLKVIWKKTDCDGYELVYATNKSFSGKNTVRIKKSSVVDYSIDKAIRGKTYYIKIRAYKTVDGERVYGYYSEVKSVKIK